MKKIDVFILLIVVGLLVFWYWKKGQDELEDRLPDDKNPPKRKPPTILDADTVAANFIETPVQNIDARYIPIGTPRPSVVGAPVTDARALVNKIPPAYQAN